MSGSRGIIWRANGKLMEQYQIDQVRAFAIVVCLSRATTSARHA
jgi:hypothetical protein